MLKSTCIYAKVHAYTAGVYGAELQAGWAENGDRCKL